MSGYALAMNLDIPKKEAEALVKGYLGGFPSLASWMNRSREFATKHGYIKNKLGRIRHLPNLKKIHEAFQDQILNWKFKKELEKQYGVERVMGWYRDYKNGRNNAINFQIQSLAAGVVNRAAIAINRKAKEIGIDAYVEGQVHDQLIINVSEHDAEMFKDIVQDIMENIFELDGVTLKAPPEIASNWSEGH